MNRSYSGAKTRRGPARALRARAAGITLLVAGLVAPAVAGAAVAPEAGGVPQVQQREERRTFTAGAGTIIDLENLAGRITIEGGASQIEIVATVNAESGRRADAATLLGLLAIDFEERGSEIRVRADYPVERFDTYRYPSGSQGRSYSTTQTRYREERVTVTGRDDSDAVSLWVDFAIRVPAGVSLDLENTVGDVTSTALEGDLSVDNGAGDVRASGGRGRVAVDTGSGRVVVRDHTGDVEADTGSGDVEVRSVIGDVTADTGSGNVIVSDVEGRRIAADTGSGDIVLDGVSGDINADTGSGNITGSNLRAGARLVADSGSGDVRFSGDLSGARQIAIDTSSGDVDLDMSAFPGMRISIETGSGSISVDLPGLSTIRSRRSYFRGEVGDGSAELTIDTGSGSVRIRKR